MTLLALGRDLDATVALGRSLAEQPGVVNCTVHLALSPDAALPYAAVLRVDGDVDPEQLRAVAAVGLYREHERHVKQRPVEWPLGTASPGVAAVFGTRRHPSLDRAAYDEHWRDGHGPLAVRHHVGMWDYWQCVLDDDLLPGSVDYDGVAIVQFPSMTDLEERFFDGPEGRAAIQADAASFTDLTVLDRVLMEEVILRRD